MKYFNKSLYVIFILFFVIACKSNTPIESNIIQSEDGKNFSIETNNSQNKFIYPFVQDEKTYSVYLEMMDKNWGNHTTTKKNIHSSKGWLRRLFN